MLVHMVHRYVTFRWLFVASQAFLMGCQSGFLPGAAPRSPEIVQGAGPLLAPTPMPQYAAGETFAFDDGRQDTVLNVEGPGVTWSRGADSTVTVTHGFTIPATTWQTRSRRSRGSITTRSGSLWPLAVGKIQKFQIAQGIEHLDGRPFADGSLIQVFQQNWTCAVERTEKVKVRAGVFDTYRIGCYRYSAENGNWRQTRLTYGHLEKCPDEPEPGQRTSPGLGILAFGRS